MALQTMTKIWVDGELIDWADAKVHVLTHGLHYGTGALEGIRAYETPDGCGIFRLTDHMKRLHASGKILLLDVPFSVEELVEATKQTARANGLTSGYIRPLVFRGYGEMGLNPLTCPISVIIAMWPWGSYLGSDGEENGIRLKVSSWRRPDPNVIPPAAKGTAAYLNSALAKVDALQAGYDDAIMLNTAGQVAEGSAVNVFVVNGNIVTTPPSSSGALKGIRRDSVMKVASDLGYDVREAALTRSDLYVADEAFVTGTASELVPLRSVDDRDLGPPGPVTARLRDVMADAVRGKLDEYRHWVELVD